MREVTKGNMSFILAICKYEDVKFTPLEYGKVGDYDSSAAQCRRLIQEFSFMVSVFENALNRLESATDWDKWGKCKEEFR